MPKLLFQETNRSKGLHYQLMSAIFSRGPYQKSLSEEKYNKPLDIITKYGEEININTFDEQGITLLAAAVFYRQLDVVELLLSLGANPDVGDSQFSVPPLIMGIGVGEKQLRTCQMLINGGANVNYTDWFGQSPLWVASAYENIEIINLLLEKGAHVNAINHNAITPLMRAAQYGQYHNVKALLDYGASIHLKDENEYTALDYAKSKENRFLDINQTGGHESIIKLLA